MHGGALIVDLFVRAAIARAARATVAGAGGTTSTVTHDVDLLYFDGGSRLVCRVTFFGLTFEIGGMYGMWM
jgi:hypothetical protein